jgi:two-component system, sensor histidine kinase
MAKDQDKTGMAETANAAQSTAAPDWLQDFAHELRTPLGGILAIADLLAQRLSGEPERQWIEAMRASVTHLRQLSSAVIDGVGVDDHAGIHHYQPQPVDRDALIGPLAASFVARAETRGLRFSMAIDRDVPSVLNVDPVRLRQMLENLVDNAMKVIQRGSVTLTIATTPEGRVRFCVTDQGPGFLNGELARLFERRMQTAAGPKGSGIGLSLVRRYAESAGGRAGATNNPAGGADVWFEIPCWPGNQIKDRPRALVIEDSHAGRLLMRTMLEHLGFHVETAVGGSAALDCLRGGPFALMTVDRMLGDTDGVDLVTRLRSWLGPDSATRIIAVTGRIDEADRAAFAMAGADGFLPKPFSPRALADVINRLLGDRRTAA